MAKNPVAHFEIPADDPERLSGFYSELFDWKINKAQGMEYWLVSTVATKPEGGAAELGGINGGITKRPMPDARNWVNYVTVGSVDDSVRQAQSLGARVLTSKSAVPSMGWFAILADPEMNVFGVWQDDSAAK